MATLYFYIDAVLFVEIDIENILHQIQNSCTNCSCINFDTLTTFT